jgi:predicted acyl esterase
MRVSSGLGAAVLAWGTCSVAQGASPGGVVRKASPVAYEIAFREASIPMPDGVRLAADLYLPSGGKTAGRFPVLLEYLPSRKAESRDRDYRLYSYFVSRGYAVARVDMRGTGSSEGRLIAYEYTDQEQTDGEAVIDWLSRQPFSTGKVGVFGISWGGFNSIHIREQRHLPERPRQLLLRRRACAAC